MLFIKKTVISSILFLTVILAGCSIGQSEAEKIHEHLEKTVSLEKGFIEAQDPLVEAEKKEQKLFTEILDLSMEEFDKIQSKADEAIELAKSRQELIQKEKESIHAAYEEFSAVKELTQELEEEKVKKAAEQMVKTMDERHESYETLHAAYAKALEMDLELYGLLKKEDLSIDELKAYTEKLNKQYDEVMNHQETFNGLTDQYNKQKKVFYKEAGLSVEEQQVS